MLEDYRISLVPHGPALLESPADAPAPGKRPEAILVVGAVDYGMQPVQLAAAAGEVTRRGTVIRGSDASRYVDLKATRDEIEDLERLFPADRLMILSGGEATTAHVEAALLKARIAHFATHAFFSDARERSAIGGEPANAIGGPPAGETGIGAPTGRNPLLLSGLVLAGANLPLQRDGAGLPTDDGGILSSEVIASLSLSNLDLAVLSACQTAMGRVAGGEGVFGLQGPFHAAGARNVVASLWPVNDYVTSRLMRSFYRKLSAGASSKAEAHPPGPNRDPARHRRQCSSPLLGGLGHQRRNVDRNAGTVSTGVWMPSPWWMILFAGIFVAVVLALSAASAFEDRDSDPVSGDEDERCVRLTSLRLFPSLRRSRYTSAPAARGGELWSVGRREWLDFGAGQGRIADVTS